MHDWSSKTSFNSLTPQGRNCALNTFTDDYVTRLAVERLAYVCANFDRELTAHAKDPAAFDASVEVAPKGTRR